LGKKREEKKQMSFQPWKTCVSINPFCVCVCVLLIETSGCWETKRAKERKIYKRESHHRCWRDIELYMYLSTIGRHAAWGSLRSGFVTPQSAGWWMGIVAIGSLWFIRVFGWAPTTHSHLSHTHTHTLRV
jgi:hypothetical protein